MKIREKLLEHVHAIGIELIDKAQVDDHGVFWETTDLILDEENIIRDKKADISNGVAGIILFLLELYKLTKENRYLDLVIDSSKWLIRFCKEEQVPFSLYNGRIGIALTLFRVYDVCQDETLLRGAKEIIYDHKDTLDEDRNISPYLFDGLAGIVLGLTHYYERTKDSVILDDISAHVDALINMAKIDKHGLYWGDELAISRGMCGYLKGNAGIGYVFYELGHYFNNDQFYFLAKQAFNFENSFLNNKTDNWPDVYKPIRNAGELADYKKKLKRHGESFLSPSYTNFTLFQGTAGIGMSRLSSLSNRNLDSHSDNYQHDVDRAVRILTENFSHLLRDDNSYSLDFGSGGAGIFLMEVFKLTKSSAILDFAIAIAQRAFIQKEELNYYKTGYEVFPNTDCLSLSMGSTGVGYFFLQLLNPESCDSIFSLTLQNKYASNTESEENSFKHLDMLWLEEKMLKMAYPRTIEVLNLIGTKGTILQGLGKDECITSLKNRFTTTITELASVHNIEVLRDVLSYEEFNESLRSTIHNPLAIYLRQEIVKSQNELLLEKCSDEKLMKFRYNVSPDVACFETSWDWGGAQLKENVGNTRDSADKVTHLFYKHSHGLVRYKINKLNVILLGRFSKAAKASSVIQDLIEEYDGEEKENVRIILTKQVKELIKAHLLVHKKDLSDLFL